MSNYDNDNRGAIWKNEKKSTEKHPDFTGKATIGGIDYYVSAWKRGPDDNPKAPALRFSVTAVEEVASQGMQQAKKAIEPELDDDSDLPF